MFMKEKNGGTRNIGSEAILCTTEYYQKKRLNFLLETAKDEMEKAILALVIGAGARTQEIEGLRVTDFVYIRNTIKLLDKRKNEFRNVILSDRTSKILNQYLLKRKDKNPYFSQQESQRGK